MTIDKLQKHLDEHNIKYVVLKHSKAYTAQEIAEASHVSGKILAKAVILRVDGELAMAVLPGNAKVNLEKLKDDIGANQIEIPKEDEFSDRFPDCPLGAIPPFGNLWGMKVYLAQKLVDQEEIVCNAGSYTDLIQLSTEGFKRLVEPKVIPFAV